MFVRDLHGNIMYLGARLTGRDTVDCIKIGTFTYLLVENATIPIRFEDGGKAYEGQNCCKWGVRYLLPCARGGEGSPCTMDRCKGVSHTVRKTLCCL